MPRLARVVVPGVPHHITQRGNRRQQTFFGDDDYQCYIDLMAEWCGRCEVKVWAYCLMPNHIHLIVVPCGEDAWRRAVGYTHRRQILRVNLREGWREHLRACARRTCLPSRRDRQTQDRWQDRFASFRVDDGRHLVGARYVELNPVRAGLDREPWQYQVEQCGCMPGREG